MLAISVIICTYNPDAKVLGSCLEAVSAATARYAPAEIIIIDNNSAKPVQEVTAVKALLNNIHTSRVVKEEKQGLTQARLRGIREARGQMLVFVDDDNIIDEFFFENVAAIAAAYPFIASFSGQVSLQTEAAPPEWTRRYWGMLVHREFSGNSWSNLPFNQESMPCGAGLCVSREAALHYLHLHETGKREFYLDREKNMLLSGGDNDLAMCACDIGKGMGLFASLKLKHVMPVSRFTLKYLSKLAHGIYYSEVLLRYMRTGRIPAVSGLNRFKTSLRASLMKREDALINKACSKGRADAIKMLRQKTKL